MARVSDRWDRFEASILRICRGNYLAMAVLGAAAVVGGGVMALLGIVQGVPTQPALPPEVAPPAALTLSEVEQMRATRAELFDVEKATERSLTTPYRRDQEVPEALKALFTEPPYVWLDVMQEYCRVPSDYGCLQKGKKIAKPGVHRLISSLLGEMSDREARDLLNGVLPVIKEAALEKRSQFLLPAGVAYLQAAGKRQSVVEEREQKVEAIKEKHAAAVAAKHAQKELMVAVGLYGVLSGLSAVLLAGLFLAFLAIERHLRDMRGRQAQREEV